jgi:hypothetical protein
MDGSSDVVKVGQIEHLHYGAESRVGAQKHESFAVRGLKMVCHWAQRSIEKWCTALEKPHWGDELKDKIVGA